MADYLFVYGTLRSATGHPRSELLAGDEPMGPGRIRGRLYDAGPFPAVVISETPSETVRGDVYLLASPEARLVELDRIENCPSETAPEEGLFRREATTVDMDDGRSLRAWVYTWARPLEGLVRVPSGDYLLHLKKQKNSS